MLIDETRGPGILRKLWIGIGLAFWHLLFLVFNRVIILGKDHRPRPAETGIFLLYNHVSAIDPFLVAATSMPFLSKISWRAPAKEELFQIPIVRWLLETWGAFPVRRRKADRGAMEKMVRLVRTGVIVLAPEGTRSTDGKLLRGRSGVGKIIYDSRPSKVIPVAIRGIEAVLPKGSIVPRIGKTVWIEYGVPLELTTFFEREDDVETSQAIVDAVMADLDRLLQHLDQQRTLAT